MPQLVTVQCLAFICAHITTAHPDHAENMSCPRCGCLMRKKMTFMPMSSMVLPHHLPRR